MKSLAIIPARSGSKGLKDKNIKLLGSKPLLAYSIGAAIESNVFNEIMVSTDSAEYAQIAKTYGASVPFLRSAELSDDCASSWDVVKDVINKYKEQSLEFDTVCLLQPTSPLRTADDIKNAYSLFKEKKAKAVVSVCETEHSPLWCNTLPGDLSMCGFVRPEAVKPRQNLNAYYRINGAVYIVESAHLFSVENIYTKNCFAYVMDKMRSVDIDSEMDFMLAEVIVNKCFNT